MNTSIPIIFLGCEHDGATEPVYSPIAWPSKVLGTTFGGGLRTKNLTSSLFRQAWLWLPARTVVNQIGRVCIATAGDEVAGGTLTLPTYQIVRVQMPTIDQTNGNFTGTTGQEVSLSATVTDVHTSINWATLPPLVTNIDMNASTDFVGQPLSWFSHIALRINAPYKTGGGSAGMFVSGISVQNW